MQPPALIGIVVPAELLKLRHRPARRTARTRCCKLGVGTGDRQPLFVVDITGARVVEARLKRDVGGGDWRTLSASLMSEATTHRTVVSAATATDGAVIVVLAPCCVAISQIGSVGSAPE